MKQHLKYLSVVGVLGLFAALSTTVGQAAERVLRITNSPCVCYLPMLVAVKQGWLEEDLKKAGVKLDVQSYQDGPSQNAAFLSGSLDVAQIGLPGLALIAKGAPVKIFMVSDEEVSTEGLVVRKSANIGSVADLKGKTIGVTAGSSSDYALRATLKAANVDIGDVKVLPAPPPALSAAWSRGDVDAAYTWDPFLTQLARNDGTVLSTIGGLSKSTNGAYSIQNFYMVGAKFAEENPDILKVVAHTISRSVDYIAANPDKVAADFLQEFGVDTAAEALVQIKGEKFYDAKMQLGADLLGEPGKPGKLVDSLMGVWQFNFDTGKVTTPPNRDTIVKAIDTSALVE